MCTDSKCTEVYWRILTASGVLKVYWRCTEVYWPLCTDCILMCPDCRCTDGILKCTVYCVLMVYWCVLIASVPKCTNAYWLLQVYWRCTEGVLTVYWCVLTAGVLMVNRSVLSIVYWRYTDVYCPLCTDCILMCTDCWCTDVYWLLQVYWRYTEVYCPLCTDCILMCTDCWCTDGILKCTVLLPRAPTHIF